VRKRLFAWLKNTKGPTVDVFDTVVRNMKKVKKDVDGMEAEIRPF